MKEYMLYRSLIPHKIECDSVGPLILSGVRTISCGKILEELLFASLSFFYHTFLECGNCKHPYFIGEVSAPFSVGTFTNIFNSSPLEKKSKLKYL